MRQNYSSILRILFFAVPAVMFQTIYPVFPTSFYEQFNEFTYAKLAQNEDANREFDVQIIEIDQKTINKFGWPVPRDTYADLLSTLEKHGHPWILSLLFFQSQKSDKEKDFRPDQILSHAIKQYDKYIGSGIGQTVGAELSESQEMSLRSVILAPNGTFAEGMPYLPFVFKEDQIFTDAEYRFGLHARFGTESVIYCTDLYLDGKVGDKPFAVPTALLWASVLSTGRQMILDNGYLWKNPLAPDAPALSVSAKHCLSNPGQSTSKYLNSRHVSRTSMADFLEKPADLTKSVVILASDDMRRYQGPGKQNDDSGIVSEHLLLARFLDDLMNNESLRMIPVTTKAIYNYLPFIVAGFLCIPLLQPAATLLLAGIVGFIFLLVSYYAINTNQIIDIPAGAILSLLSGVILYSLFLAALAIQRLRIHFRFLDNIKRELALCISRDGMELAVKKSFFYEFPQTFIEFKNYGLTMQQPPTDIKEIWNTILVKRKAIDQPVKSDSTGIILPQAKIDIVKPRWNFLIDRNIFLEGTIDIIRSENPLGQIQLKINATTHAKKTAQSLINALASELRVHWNRLELLHQDSLAERQRLILGQEIHMGRLVQNLLLPKIRSGHIGQWEYRIDFEPYGPMAGDWMQIYKSPDGERGIIAIGDVVGKGTGAALITAAIASLWKTLEFDWAENDIDAGMILQIFDKTIGEIFQREQNSTLSMIVFSQNTVTLTSAGAPSWLHLKAAGKIETHRLKPPCDALGVNLKDFPFQVKTLTPATGDILLAYTDGLMDGTRSKQRFINKIESQNFSDVTFDTIKATANEMGAIDRLDDDLTVLMVRRH